MTTSPLISLVVRIDRSEKAAGHNFFVSNNGRHTCLLLCRRVRKDFFDAGLIINEPKCQNEPALCLHQLGFDVDMGEGKFRVPVDRWEALQAKADVILAARGGRIQARKLSSFTDTMIFMKQAWGLVTQLYMRHLYALVTSLLFMNCWVTLTDEARGELLF